MTSRGIPREVHKNPKYPTKCKSFVWEHFGFYMGDNAKLDESHCICMYCHHSTKNDTSTGTMANHIRNKHADKLKPKTVTPQA